MSHQNPPARAKRSLSAVTSGRKLFVEGDPNSAWSRRYRDLVSHHVADAGGRDMISEAQLSLIRRASALELELEALEGRLSRGEAVNLDSFGRAASHLRRLFESIGLRRTPRETPSLAEYLAGLQAESEPEATDEADDEAHDEGEDQ